MKALSVKLIVAVFLFTNMVWSVQAQVEDEIPKLRPVRTEIPLTYWESRGRGLVLYSVEFVAWLAFTIWLLTRPQPAAGEPIEVITRRELDQLRQQRDEATMLSGVARCLRRYFGAAFHLPAGEHTTEEFCRLILAHQSIGSSLAERTAIFLRQCDAARFAANTVLVADAGGEAAQLVEQAEARRRELRQLEREAATKLNP